MTFEEAYRQFHPEIRRLSYSQYVPGLEQEDVESEMLIVLWKAVETHDPETGPLGTLWWAMWHNRRVDLIAAHNALKRVHGIPLGVLPDTGITDPTRIPVPGSVTGVGALVWTGLAVGDSATEIKTDLGISNRRYYSLINEWRTNEVRNFLLSQ